MRVGGGHIGAYAALALPFSLSLLSLRPRWLGVALATPACLGGAYTLVVTFARTGYAAGLVAMLVTGLGWLWIALRHRRRAALAALLPVPLVLAALAATAAWTGMYQRFAASESDLSTREQNWRAGLAVRDPGIVTALFGMGLGTYQRTMLARSPVNRPTDLALGQDGAGAYVSMRLETPFYLGQKITLPQAGPIHLAYRSRSPDGMTASASICDKILLYSDNCQSTGGAKAPPNQWTLVQATLPSTDLGRPALHGLLRRPVELALSGPIGHRIDVRDITLTDDAGHALLLNGDFRHGLDRWIFTDDSHVSWRMLNEYLMLWFETGLLGLASYAALSALALAGALLGLHRGATAGDPMAGDPMAGAPTAGALMAGAPVAGAIAGFLISGLFDNVLEAPRLATLFFLVCWAGLILWEARPPLRSA
jgi:hypothetical protein